MKELRVHLMTMSNDGPYRPYDYPEIVEQMPLP